MYAIKILERKEIDRLFNDNYKNIIKNIQKYHKVNKSKAQDLLHDVYVNIIDKTPNNVTIGYILIAVRNNFQQKDKQIDIDILNSTINNDGMIDVLKAKNDLFELIYNEICYNNFTFLEEAILKHKIYKNDSFESIGNLIGISKMKTYRTYIKAIKKLRIIIDDKYNFNSNNDSYWHQLDANINS